MWSPSHGFRRCPVRIYSLPRRLVLPCVGALGVVLSCSHSEAVLEPLPALVTEGFAPAVGEQLSSSHARAAAAPHDPSVVGELGRVLYVFGQFRGAAQCFSRSRALQPDSFEWTYLLGVALADLGEEERALSALRAAAKMRPRDIPTALRLADLLAQSGDSDQARETLGAALNLAPSSAAILYRLGRLESSRDLAVAQVHLEKALEVEPHYREARYALASVHRSAGRTNEADEQLKLYRDSDPTPRRHYADPLLDALISIKTNSAQRAFNEGRARHNHGDLEGALRAFGDALEIDPGHAQAHANMIAVHGQMGNREQASLHYRRSVELDPSIAEAHYNIGVTRHLAGDFVGAAEAFRKTLEINPQDADAHSNLGTALEQLGRGNESLRHYCLALEHNPIHPTANFHVGKVLADQQRYTESLPYLERAVESDTKGSGLHAYVLALVLRELGQHAPARGYMRLALRLARARGQDELVQRIELELGN